EARVEDNGAGFDVEEVLKDPGRKSLGIFGMRERIGLLNGTVEVQSRKGEGTRLIFTAPQVQKIEHGGDNEQDKGHAG
ncbi:MAG: ATP-binding protein, partial [Chloroflexota bacterium]